MNQIKKIKTPTIFYQKSPEREGGVRRRLTTNSDLRRRKHEEAHRAKTCHKTLKKAD